MGLVWPDNVHEQVARPTNGPDPIVAGDRSRSSELEEETWSRPRSEVLVSYGRVRVSEDLRRANFVTNGSRLSLGATVSWSLRDALDRPLDIPQWHPDQCLVGCKH